MLARARPRLSLAALVYAPRRQPLGAQTHPRTRPRGTGCRSHHRSTRKVRTGSHPSPPSSAVKQAARETGENREAGAEAGLQIPGGAPWSVSLVINKGKRLAAWVGCAGVGALYIFLGEGGRPQWPGSISISHHNPRRGCLGKPPPFL